MFGWIKAAFGRGANAISLVSPWLRGISWTISRNFLGLARDGYGSNSIVYACLRLLSTAVPEPPLLPYALDSKQERTLLPFDHPLAQLIRRPNPLQTEYEFWEMTTLHAAIAGRAHWYKQRDNAGRIKYLWPLRPDRVGPRYAGSGTTESVPRDQPGVADGMQQVLAGWNYWQPGLGEPVVLAVQDVMTFNLPDPSGETGGLVEGLGPLQVLAREIETDSEATNFVGSLLKNHATPGVVIRLKQGGVSKQQAALVKQHFMAQFGGTKRGEPAILDGDTEITQLGFNLNQLEFPHLRHISETRISACLGVPAILVGLDAGLKSGIRATISEQREYFAETTLANYWRRFSDKYTIDVAAEFGDRLVCLFDTRKVKALASQGRYETNRIQIGFAAGAVTIDEYRVGVLQLPPLPNGAGDVTILPRGGVETAPDHLNETQIENSEEGMDNATSGKVLRAARQRMVLPVRRPQVRVAPVLTAFAHKTATRAHTRAVRHNRDERTRSYIDRYAPRIHDVLTRMAVDTVARLPEIVASLKADTPLVDPDLSTQLQQTVTALHQDVLADAHRDAGQTLGVTIRFDVYNPRIADVLGELTTSVKGIDETTRQAIRDLVAQATREGWGPGELATHIREAGAFGSSRAMAIARTETGLAYNHGSILAYRESGVVSKVEVLDGVHDGPCASANHQIWTLEQATMRPLQHTNCVRAFAPIIDTATAEDAA